MRRRRGFTLIELLVVLAIVATLLTLALPRYYGKVQATREAVLRENLRTTRDIIGKFYGDHGRYPESLDELVDRKYLIAAPRDPLTDSSTSWVIQPPNEGDRGAVYDLHSGASGVALDGTPYAQW
jgi:general secretion pathway protein G